jgi:hypothetical protein
VSFIKESSDSRDIAHLVIVACAERCYLGGHSHGSVKDDAKVAHAI